MNFASATTTMCFHPTKCFKTYICGQNGKFFSCYHHLVLFPSKKMLQSLCWTEWWILHLLPLPYAVSFQQDDPQPILMDGMVTFASSNSSMRSLHVSIAIRMLAVCCTAWWYLYNSPSILWSVLQCVWSKRHKAENIFFWAWKFFIFFFCLRSLVNGDLSISP